jgi:hypothetical protein
MLFFIYNFTHEKIAKNNMRPDTKDVFMEYCLEYVDSDGPDTLYNDKLTYLLKYIRRHGLRSYTIKGFKNGEWQVMIKY